MSTLIRFFTLLTIAAAGFALPMTCAQSTSAAETVIVEIPAIQHEDSAETSSTALPGVESTQKLTKHLLDTFPLDCGDGSTPRVSDQPASVDTQPFVPGYLVSTLQLTEESSDFFAPPPALVPIESRAGPPDAPPPKSID